MRRPQIDRNQPSATFTATKLFALVSIIVLSGCTTLGIDAYRRPVPFELTQVATIPNAQNVKKPIRYWGDVSIDQNSSAIAKVVRENINIINTSTNLHALSLSGGGYNGAFGTGFLLGWTERGDRPEFEIVTGISVGALIAPFAFLGSEYDQELQGAFRRLASEKTPGSGVLGILFGASSLESNKPIAAAISQAITPETLSAIAVEHKKGRRLLIGTTNIDVERPVIWDIGEIANSDVPDKITLVRNIMLASAALPGIYPPIQIEVEANGERYDEMHVDGGLTQQVVLAPDNINLSRNPKNRRILYIIYNGKIAPDYEPVKASALDILIRAVPSFIKSLGRNDVTRLSKVAGKNNATVKIAAMPADLKVDNRYPPAKEYLDGLIQRGFDMGKSADWTK